MTWLRGWVGAVLAGAMVLAGCDPDILGRPQVSVRVNPDQLDFGAVALGRDRVVDLTVTNESRVPYNIYEISSTAPNFEVLEFEPLQLSAGESRVLKVRFAPKTEGEAKGALAINSDEAGAGQNLPIEGLGVKAYVEVKQRVLDYGRVDVDTAKVLEVEVSNPTAVETPVRFTFEGQSAHDFSSSESGQDLMLQPGEARRIPIAFKPVMVGLADAVAKFSICETCEPLVVTLSGEGITGMIEIFPTRLDFGRVSLGATTSQDVLIRNNGNEDVQVTSAALDGTSQADGALTVRTKDGLPLTLGQNEQTLATVTFTPRVPGVLQGRYLKLGLVADNALNPTLGISGEGGASCVTLVPRAVDFGTVPEGMSATRRVDVFNRCAYDVSVTEAKAEGQGGYFSLGQLAAVTVVPAGKAAPVEVTYTPKTGSSSASGTLTVKVLEQSAWSVVQIPLTGASKQFQPCSWSIEPGALDFGAVTVGAEVTLGVTLTNTGTDQCFVGRMQLAAGSDTAFRATAVSSTVLDPGQKALLKITFKPMSAGSFMALAEGWVNHPTDNHPTATISGRGVQGCFALQPTNVDFGTVKLSCGARTRTVVAYNACQAPVQLTQAAIDTTSTSDFVLGGAPALPFTLQPGAQQQLQLTYEPQNDGDDVAALRVTADGVVYTAGLLGAGLTKPTRTDVFVQDSQSKVDVLFVIDNSGSMMEEQQSLGQNFAAFLSAAQSQNIDYHIAVTTTGIESSPGGWSVCPGGAEGGEGGRLFPVTGTTPRIITPTTPNAAQVFATNVNVGWCHWNEQGLEGAYRALSTPLVNSGDDTRTAQPADGNAGFLRPDAKLAIVFLSDEDDYSPQPVAFYETFFKALKNDATQLSISAIVGPTNLGTCPTASSAGTRYIALANATGGVVESICTSDWAKSLENLSLSAFGPARRFPLSEQPADATQLVVEVNGVPVTSGWSYDAASNTVVFEESAAPAAGTVLEITYPLGC